MEKRGKVSSFRLLFQCVYTLGDCVCLTSQQRCHVPLSAHDIAWSLLICNPGEVSGGDHRGRDANCSKGKRELQIKVQEWVQNVTWMQGVWAGLAWNGCACVHFWSFWNNNRPERGLSATSEASTARSHLSTPISAVCVLPSGLRSRTEHDETMTKGRAREWQFVMGRKTIWAKSFYCVIGAACECVVTALHLLENAKDDSPLMSFTVIQLSQCDWLVTAPSLNISIISLLGCIRKLLGFNLNAFLFLRSRLTEVSIF